MLTFELFSSTVRDWLWTGFCAYITTATEMRMRARTVWRVSGIPSRGTLSTAVITSSSALAKAFSIELSFLRNKLVMMPRTELFIISRRTKGLLIDCKEETVKALRISP